jgi:hypothetical protein
MSIQNELRHAIHQQPLGTLTFWLICLVIGFAYGVRVVGPTIFKG